MSSLLLRDLRVARKIMIADRQWLGESFRKKDELLIGKVPASKVECLSAALPTRFGGECSSRERRVQEPMAQPGGFLPVPIKSASAGCVSEGIVQRTKHVVFVITEEGMGVASGSSGIDLDLPRLKVLYHRCGAGVWVVINDFHRDAETSVVWFGHKKVELVDRLTAERFIRRNGMIVPRRRCHV